MLAPADHIGAVGPEGTVSAEPCEALQRIAYATRETLLGDTLLGRRREAHRSPPLILPRAETDRSGRIAELAEGPAFDNLLAAADRLCSAARSHGKRSRVLAVGPAYGLEDTASDVADLVHGLRTLVAKVEQ